jgi:integrator complex subunit 9
MTARTIQSHHNAILVAPSMGIMFDLIGDIDAYFKSLGREIGHERHQTQIFVANPIADQSLKYANICGEWMNAGRHDLLYLPQMPLTHGELMRTGAVQTLPSLEAVSLENKTIREPCIVFAGDPTCISQGSLSWFLNHWGQSEFKSCIFIGNIFFFFFFVELETRVIIFVLDPDTPHNIQDDIPIGCKMNLIRLPLDTRLKLEDIPSVLQTYWDHLDSRKHLLIPSMKGAELVKEEQSQETQVHIYEQGEVININVNRDWERVSVSEKVFCSDLSWISYSRTKKETPIYETIAGENNKFYYGA